MSIADTSNLAAWLHSLTPLTRESDVWGDGTLPLEIASYVSDALPSQDYITSVRSLVFRGDSILLFRNRRGAHIIPGGRREAGETFDQTLRREVLEEAGWTIGSPSLLGFQHFHHLAPKPRDYLYPHPDFVQVLYMSEADEARPDAKLKEDYEHESSFRSISEIESLPIPTSQKMFLDAALKLRSPRKRPNQSPFT